MYVEFGNDRTREYAPMRRAMGIPVTGHDTRPSRRAKPYPKGEPQSAAE
jgi:hypothetical protein